MNEITGDGVGMQMRKATINAAQKQTAIDKAPPLTIEEVIALGVRLQPAQAAREGNNALCVTPLIDRVIVDGQIVQLSLQNNRWGAGYPRVSDIVQRASASRETKKKSRRELRAMTVNTNDVSSESDPPRQPQNRRNITEPDGFSEEEQLNRQIRYFIHHKQAFRIYSDAGVTGEFPTNDPLLIKRLLEAKAKRYKKIFERTLLDETSSAHRTPEEIASMRAYLNERVREILDGQDTVTDSPDDTGDCEEETETSERHAHLKRRRARQPRLAVFFRQGLTALWNDISSGRIHTVAVSDRSRLCRAADMESEFLDLLAKHQTRLVGLVEDLSSLDVSDPLKKGVNYMIASINEYRLEEVAGHAMRGTLQLLESGRPTGKLPFWCKRDSDGRAILIEERANLMRRIVDLSLAGLGLKAIARRLHDENIRINGKSLSFSVIAYALTNDAMVGSQRFFGLAWPVFPRLIDDSTYNELREMKKGRDDKLSPRLHDTRHWAEHLLTGVCHCGICGGSLQYNPSAASRTDSEGPGYYLCKAPYRMGESDSIRHGCLNASKIEGFFHELMSSNPHLIRQAFESVTTKTEQGAAVKMVLEGQLHAARARHAEAVSMARTKASEMVEQMGLSTTSAGFSAAVEGVMVSLLETETAALLEVERQWSHVDAQSTKDRQADRALKILQVMDGWTSLDTLARNRILRSLFSVAVYPIPLRTTARCRNEPPIYGYMEIRLLGVDVVLPPVRYRRGFKKVIEFPSVEEWIADMFPTGITE